MRNPNSDQGFALFPRKMESGIVHPALWEEDKKKEDRGDGERNDGRRQDPHLKLGGLTFSPGGYPPLQRKPARMTVAI